jgi:hypothetical protein
VRTGTTGPEKTVEALRRSENKEFTFGFRAGGRKHCIQSAHPVALPPCLSRTFQQRRAQAKDRNASWVSARFS